MPELLQWSPNQLVFRLPVLIPYTSTLPSQLQDLKHKCDQPAPSNTTCDHNKNTKLPDYNMPSLGIQDSPGLKLRSSLWLDQSVLPISGFMLQQPLSAPNSSCTSCCFLPLLLTTLLSLLPRTPHLCSLHLANSYSRLSSLVSLRKASLIQKD